MRASGYRPGGMFRLMSMLTMLVVLGLIIARASDPATWAWLASDDQGVAGKPAAKAGPAEPAKAPIKPVTAQTKPETVTQGPTDEDIEQQDGASEEFMAVTDGGLEQRVEEMPAYWRLFGWVQHQSSDQMRKRASKQVVFNQFIRDPDKQRGKLIQLTLNVRQVYEYPATNNRVGVDKVYEIRAFTTESKAWLYFLLTPELPAGMPVGTDVYERATFTGYFLKLQGYHEAGAGPHDKPLAAPLLIGRLAWKPSALAAAQAESDWDWLGRQLGPRGAWIWWVAGLVVLLGILRMGLWMYGRLVPERRAIQAAQSDFESTRKVADVRNWLSDAQDDFVPADDPAHWNGDGSARKRPDYHNN